MIITLYNYSSNMQDTKYKIVNKDVENPAGDSITKYQQVTIRVQEQGSTGIVHSGVIGKGDFNASFESIVIQMRKGQKWTVKDQRQVKHIVEVVELGKIVDGRNYFQIADTLKSEGNGYIKTKSYAKAIDSYTQAYNLLVNDPSAKAQQLKLSIVSNLALATLNSSQFKATLQWCDMHLEETIEANVKIIYRRASANKGLKQWQQTRKDISVGIEGSKGDSQSISNFNKLLAQVQKEQKEQKLRQKALYGKMFN